MTPEAWTRAAEQFLAALANTPYGILIWLLVFVGIFGAPATIIYIVRMNRADAKERNALASRREDNMADLTKGINSLVTLADLTRLSIIQTGDTLGQYQNILAALDNAITNRFDTMTTSQDLIVGNQDKIMSELKGIAIQLTAIAMAAQKLSDSANGYREQLKIELTALEARLFRFLSNLPGGEPPAQIE